MPGNDRTTAPPSLVAADSPGAFLHVGPPKTGTTYLQSVLWNNRKALLRDGVLLPGAAKVDHFRAAKDLKRLNRRGLAGLDGDGPWGRLATQMRDWPGRSVVSTEWLAASGPRAVRTMVESLGDVPVHVVITLRDLGRLVPAVWQERVKNGTSRTLATFLTELRYSGQHEYGRAFWNVHDPRNLVRRSCKALPAERVHLVILPLGGSPPDELWRRFAGLVVADPSAYDTAAVRANPSLSAADAEFLRRVNAELDGRMPRAEHARYVKKLLANATLAGREGAGERIALDVDNRAWLSDRADKIIDELASSGCHVVGDLDELRVARDGPPTLAGPEDADPSALAQAGVAAVTALLLNPRDNTGDSAPDVAPDVAPDTATDTAPGDAEDEDDDLPAEG